MTTRNKIMSDLNQGLGALVWWDLGDTLTTPDDMRHILQTEGITDIKVPDIDPIQGAKTAAREWTQGRGNADRYRADVSYLEAGREIEVGILKLTQVTDKEVAWKQVDSCTFKVDTGMWSSTNPASREVQSFLRRAITRQTYLDHSWVRPHLVQGLLKKAASFRLRRRGGMEFVPMNNIAEVERLQNVVERLGNSEFNIGIMADTEGARKSVGKAAHSSVMDDVESLIETLEAWEGGDRKPRASSLKNTIEEFQSLRSRASLYKSTFEVTIDDLNDAIAVAEARALALVKAA